MFIVIHQVALVSVIRADYGYRLSSLLVQAQATPFKAIMLI